MQNTTEELYHHLDLTRCVWTFNAWFTLSQLAETCGGQVISHFQVSVSVMSALTSSPRELKEQYYTVNASFYYIQLVGINYCSLLVNSNWSSHHR